MKIEKMNYSENVTKRAPRRARFAMILAMIMLTGSLAFASQTDITGPTGSGTFGNTVVALPNGNIVVVDTGYDAPGPILDVGAVYLYNGKTGELISMITGSTAADNIGSSTTGITVLANGNFVIRSPNWDNGAVTNAGAATFCSGTTGCSGVVSEANSIVGSTASDVIGGGGIMALSNGNYVIRTPNWDAPGPVANVGAVTFCSGATGCSGVITSSNSLVGTTASDTIGNSGFTILPNDNYIVNSSGSWDNGAATNAGAVTFCSGTTGCVGEVSAANSLVGSTASDNIGTVTVLANGNFIVAASNWDNGAAANVGSATFCSGTTGCPVGPVSSSNSLIGATAADGSNGTSITTLANGNYIYRIPGWDNGAVVDAGATVFCDGTAGCTPGPVSTSNALYGSSTGDGTSIIVTPLTNNNYVVTSSSWDNGATANVGAATWCSGTVGCVGAISTSNSLVGVTSGDTVSSAGILALTNGNYVVRSTAFINGGVTGAGAATWCNGATGCVGTVSAANSLVGSTTSDAVGQFGTALPNGNYVIRSVNWDNGAIANAGAITWCDGVGGTTVGPVSDANSLVGSAASDQIGTSLFVLPNGNFVVTSSNWDNGAIVDAGATTWCNAAGGCAPGAISAANSLVGSTASDRVGGQSVFVVGTSNYVVRSTGWDTGAVTDAGAVTFCNGSNGCTGPITTSNSLVGATASDGIGTVTVLTNGNYMVSSSNTDNGAIVDAGSLTWGDGTNGTVGTVSLANSLMGATASDQIGSASVTALVNGNFLARSTNYDNGAISQAGAFSYLPGNGPMTGLLSDTNSVSGTVAGGASRLVSSFNALTETLVVGRPDSNIVTVFNPTYTSVSNGNWSAAATWNYGSFVSNHDVVVPNGRSIALDSIARVDSLQLDCTGLLTGASASAYVIGKIQKNYCSTGLVTLPTGTENGYSPLDTNIFTLATNPSSLTVNAIQSVHPSLEPSVSLKRYWSTVETGDLTAELTFHYLDPTDISTAESTYKLYRVDGGVPTQITPITQSTTSNTIRATGVTQFGDFAIGNRDLLVADGTFDLSFGNQGVATVDFNGDPTPGDTDADFGLDVTVQPDGKILMSGESFISTTDSVMSATRLNTDGTVDTSFATNGRFMFNAAPGIGERAYGIAVQPDGKIVIAGRTNSPRKRVVIRLNSDGSFDTGFADNGVLQIPIGSTTFDEEEIAFQTDGKILVSGATRNGGLANDAFSLMRINTDGTMDTTFDGDGEAITVFSTDDRGYDLAVQPDGKIVVSGSTINNSAMALARYNTDGSLDQTFGTGGKVITAFPSATSLAESVTIQPDGKIVAAGYERGAQADGAVVRYNPDGSLDTSFDGDGIVTFGSGSLNETFWDVHVRNGKIIATGYKALSDPSSVEDFMIVRFNPNGSLDTRFGSNGAIYTDINNTRDVCLSSAFGPDGKLVLAGYSSKVNPFNPDFAAIRYNFSTLKTPSDFDGDGRTDLAVYRPVSGGNSQWWRQESSTNTVKTDAFGLETDIATPADFDGDGKTDIAFWRPGAPNQAAFYILNSSTNTVRQEVFGQIGDNPALVADYDGDGKADPAVYREGSQSYFFYRGSFGNPNGNTTYMPWGTVGDKPVVGDFNGDGKSDFTVFRNGEWWTLRNGSASYQVTTWGLATDKVAAGDYDGDGKTDIAVFRPADGIWYILRSSNGVPVYVAWGTATDVPVPGDYDGDGKTDVSVYRDGTWYISQSSNSAARIESFGTATDTPVPSLSLVQ